jgi:DNA topoisomerase-1
MKCKQKQEMKDPLPVFTSTGTPATKGICSVCGTKQFLMGRTDAHEGLVPPEIIKPRKKKNETKRSGKLVIVESPSKAKTVGRFLGDQFTVKASVGHIRDLLRSQLSVDVDNNFKPKYRVPNEKRPVVKELKALAAKAEEVYLATDLDREGEAIAWHLVEAAEIPHEITHRVVFHEITRPAITKAFASPRDINMDLVNAQQGRRILDRLVGYKISPLLWKKVRSRLSAGRVQSVALRLIVERDREIDDFIPEEYWSIVAELTPDIPENLFLATLIKVDGEKPILNNSDVVIPIKEDMESAKYSVLKVKIGERIRKPQAPFITSTLQQSASRRLRFTARKTMRIAQQLYEGVDVTGRGQTGLITYMRTDSTHVSQLAVKEARDFIASNIGMEFHPEKPPKYKTKTKGAQEAHEAIRPTSVLRTPNSIKNHLTKDQYRLYRLIWQRFVASQMSPAVYDTISVEILGKTPSHTYLLRSTGSKLRFSGFLTVYKDIKTKQEQEESGPDEPSIPHELIKNQVLKLIRIVPNQHFTQPPSRFTDASLVKALEKYGIGRPSTYASILSTLQNRGYMRREGRRLFATETGFTVNDLLVEHFPDIVDVGFTAKIMKDIDQVALGKQSWVDIVRNFYSPFIEAVEKAEKAMPEVKFEPETVGRDCPECGNDLVIRFGRHGKFIGCSTFPNCRYTEPILEKIGVNCPKDNGMLVIRKTRKGRIFYGCENYPECDFTSWQKPLKNPCPVCGGMMVSANRHLAVCTQCGHQLQKEEIED